jgi:protein TonB
MPLSFSLVPLHASGHGATPRPAPRAAREHRLFQSSAIACAVALAIYGLLAVVMPDRVPQLPRIARYPDPTPWHSLPEPKVEHPRAPAPRSRPAPAEPAQHREVAGRMRPAPETAETPLEPGPGTTEPATTADAGVRDAGAAPAAPGTDPGETSGIADYYEEPPVPVREVRPIYPRFAADAGITGTVLLHVLVGADGRVEEVRVLASVPVLNEAAIEAARRWVFRPARVSGRPVRVWVALPMSFRLD